MEDRSKRTGAVRPQLDERCGKQRECDSVLNTTSDENDDELNGETDDEDMEDGEMGFDDGSVQVSNIRDPGQPTVKEHQEHMTTHRPYRSWCKFCVMGLVVNAPHRRSDAQDDLEGVPHVSMDYGFLGERESEEQVSPVLVIRERLGKTTPREQAVAVTTPEALDGPREKTIRIANVENSALNWVSISSAGAVDMTHRDFCVKSARDETRHIIGSSELDVIIGSDREQNRGCRKKDKDHLEFLCELHEAQVARGRHFVHELTSEVNLRERCMAKVMAMPGIRTAVTDLCMFGLAACDEGGPGFVNVSVRTITNARRVGVRLQGKCGSMHRHAQVNADNTVETRERTGSWVRQVAQAMEEQLKEDQQELETRERRRKVEDVKRTRRIAHENDKNKGLSRDGQTHAS